MSAEAMLLAPADEAAFPPITFAFQPIIDAIEHRTTAYEALVRGPRNETAHHIFGLIPPSTLSCFDENCRIVALGLAVELDMHCDLNLNLLPQGLFLGSGAIHTTIEAAVRNRFPIQHIVLEITEREVIDDLKYFAQVLNAYRSIGLRVAIDDFGSGHSGLNLLAEFQPDQLKLDRKLVCGIESHGARQAIVRAIIDVCHDLGIDLIAEGVETVPEYSWFLDHGVHLFQGYLFARPGFERLPTVSYPDIAPLFQSPSPRTAAFVPA